MASGGRCAVCGHRVNFLHFLAHHAGDQFSPRERGRQPLPRIDPWRGQLDGLLLANEGKPARERLTLIRIFEELRGLGYEGSYDAVRRYAKKWRVERGAATAEAGACPGEGRGAVELR